MNSLTDFRCALRAKFWADMWLRREWCCGLLLGRGWWHVPHANVTPIVAVNAYVLRRIKVFVSKARETHVLVVSYFH